MEWKSQLFRRNLLRIFLVFFLESRLWQIFWLIFRWKVLLEANGIPKLLGKYGIRTSWNIFFLGIFRLINQPSKTIYLPYSNICPANHISMITIRVCLT